MIVRRSPWLLAVAATLSLVACQAETATMPSTDAPQLARLKTTLTSTTSVEQASGTIVFTLLATCPQAGYDSAWAVLGPSGGSLQSGKYKLTVPPGALSSNVVISMVRPADETASLRFHPEGLVFPATSRPVVSLNFSGCSTGIAPSIVYVTEQLSLLEALPTLNLDTKGKTVSAYLDHFSRYAVAW